MVANFASAPGPATFRAYTTAFTAVRWLGGFIRFWAPPQIVFYLGHVREPRWRKSVLRFGGISAELLAVFCGLLLLPPAREIFVIIFPLAYFASDYVPLAYLLGALRQEFRGIPAALSAVAVLDGLAGASKLTKRKREIAGLILAGKDNIDIHRALLFTPARSGATSRTSTRSWG
jgi:hypothetical protein